MDDIKDAHGRAFMDHFNGRTATQVIERDDGYVDSFGSGLYFSSYHQWPAFERKAMRYVAGKVLDIGCGAGRVALYLQRKGFDVTGFDISPLALKVSRLRGVKKVKLGSLQRLDFGPRSFTTLIMFGNNFNLVGTPEGAKRFLRHASRITTERGVILAESADPYTTKEPAHLRYHESNRSKGRLSGQVRIRVRYKQYKNDWFTFLLVSKDEMKQLLLGTGWQVKSFISSRGSQYIAVLRKS